MISFRDLSLIFAFVVAMACTAFAGKHAIEGNVAMVIFNLFLAGINFGVMALNLRERG